MSTQTLNESDLDSPGYEFLRSYQNMNNLYQKLVALNYQRDFCSLYKCPPVHKYYFSIQNKNQGEQQFLFTCLCAWLIKEKCQMNLELEPEEYQDIDLTISVIFEALKLLLTPDDYDGRDIRNPINFPPGRLKQGFGPEAIYTMNILADRALELLLDSDKIGKVQVLYHNKSSSDQNRQTNAISITIGQPFVGGGLTTRPLGSYQIDDETLVLDEIEIDQNGIQNDRTSLMDIHINEADWYQQVERVRQALESANLHETGSICENWHDYLEATRESQGVIQEFLNQSKSLLNIISNRIDRHMQVISGREKFIQTNLKTQIEDFLNIWRDYSAQLTRNNNLMEKVNSKADMFESHKVRLKLIGKKVESRMKELNDGNKLKELEVIIKNLTDETDKLKLKIGLLLTVYAKRHTHLVAESAAISH